MDKKEVVIFKSKDMKNKLKGTILGLAYADALGAGYEFFKGKIGDDEKIDCSCIRST